MARNTIEEKILQLQQAKRELATQVLTPDLARALRQEDIERLFELKGPEIPAADGRREPKNDGAMPANAGGS